MTGYVALVLHAHLPYVRHPEHARSLEERWLFEALWESYLPLLGVLDRLAADSVAAPLTFSVSPPLAAMLRDGLLRRRFEEHLARTEALLARVDAHAGAAFAAPVAFYRRRLSAARAAFGRLGGDVLGAFVRHADAGRIELCTTAATHAYLPGLLAAPRSVRAQLRLGLRGFAALSGAAPPAGFWLPECAYDPRLDADLAAAGVRHTVVDAHALALAAPRSPWAAPVRSPGGVAFFARDPASAREVWSRETGYPGHPVYREFHRDVGFDLPARLLGSEVGPDGVRLMTGLKLHRVTGRGPDKAPYDPAAAAAQARAHAADFVARREASVASLVAGAAEVSGAPRREARPVLVAPFDAELLGHFWLEGPEFLERALRGLAASARAGRVAPITLRGYLERHAPTRVVQPAASTWGEGGHGAVWAGPPVAALWRHVHHAGRAVQGALAAARNRSGTAGRALDQAIRELLLLEASDWAFMIHRGDMTPYAEDRVRSHASRARRLAALAVGGAASPEDLAWFDQVCERDRFLAELAGPALRDAFDPWAERGPPSA